MDDSTPRLLELFYEVQRGLPRQGPGNNECTLRALASCTRLGPTPAVLDLGCGPGMQTLAIANALPGNILAVDNCEEYLEQLQHQVNRSSLADRVAVRKADMAALELPEVIFDLVWCEGAAYIMGIPQALQAWRPLLRTNGYLAFTELVWLEKHPAAEVASFFAAEYPAMTSVLAINDTIRESGFEPISDFTLPDSAWFDHYYAPLEAKLPALKQKYGQDEEALAVVSAAETEIDMRRRFGKSYGYQFFVARRVG